MPMMFPIQTKMFQSTYLYKVRLRVRASIVDSKRFNPRTYIRYDLSIAAVRLATVVSIHVPI